MRSSLPTDCWGELADLHVSVYRALDTLDLSLSWRVDLAVGGASRLDVAKAMARLGRTVLSVDHSDHIDQYRLCFTDAARFDSFMKDWG